MSKKLKIIIAAVVAAAIAFLWWRRRAQAAQIDGLTAATPTPMTALTALQTNVQQLPGLASQAAIARVSQLLPPVIGQGVQAVIGQTTPKPAAAGPCPPGYVGPHPADPSVYCAGVVSSRFGGASAALGARR